MVYRYVVATAVLFHGLATLRTKLGVRKHPFRLIKVLHTKAMLSERTQQPEDKELDQLAFSLPSLVLMNHAVTIPQVAGACDS